LVGVTRAWRPIAAAVVALVAATMAVPTTGAAPARVEDVPRDHRVYLVTDSVGLGAKAALPAAFPADWQVTVDGTPALFVEQLESKHVRQRMASTPEVFGDIAVVAGGYNYPYWDPARFDRSVDQMIATLRQAGVRHIFWVMLREVKQQYVTPGAWQQVQPYYWYFPTVNQHLQAALSRNPDLTLVDWAAAADRSDITYDAIHLNPVGAQLYSQLIASTIMAAVDRPAAGTVLTIPVAGRNGVPADAAAVAVSLTVASPRSSGYLTAFPCSGGLPVVSNANFTRDQVVASAAVVPVGADGNICVFTNESTHVVVDVAGSFPAGAGFASSTPQRLVDTRSGGAAVLPAGQQLVVPVAGLAGVPGDAAAVAVTVTATDPVAGGFASVTPCGTPASGTSNVNFDAGATVPNLVVVRPGVGGAVCVTANVATHLIVDVFGSFAAAADVGLVEPDRLVDTRESGVQPAAGDVVVLPIAGTAGVPADATGVMVNLTAANPRAAGYLTAYPCNASAPTASNLNVRAGVNRANFVIVAPDSDGDICVFSSAATDVIVDLLGWVGTAFTGVVPTRVLDTRT
jgi:hypothetical protein